MRKFLCKIGLHSWTHVRFVRDIPDHWIEVHEYKCVCSKRKERLVYPFLNTSGHV